MEETYKVLSSTRCISLLKADLPLNLRQVVLAVLESGLDSTFDVRITKLNYIYKLELIEHNRQENFTVCHCFSTDTISVSSDNYTYETISLPHLESLYHLATEI
ncbi:hypothetical protein [Paenibacillus sp. S150]|uniref:hypothetical protein n=1 Tax=Paenibacillus sp. S150 TaxID=2749826 RepID=UPI001C565795|nr:hypothetical protein [Paenibacillus sp. S150]MBW4084198.1 hypothetical protein [Paenibacillus sp. S150]